MVNRMGVAPVRSPRSPSQASRCRRCGCATSPSAFGKFTAVSGVDLDLAEGSFVSAWSGPTGCGKSTLLNVITGLRRPQAGSVEVFGAPLVDLNDHCRLHCCKQDVLLPWKTTIDNVALGLIFQGARKIEARDRARLWLEKVGLGHCAERYPHELSGGMKKRAAMAQALILSPRIVLMDEPVRRPRRADAGTRWQNELLRLWHEEKMTILFITHDLEEAITLADRVVVMGSGPAARPAADFTIPIERPRDVAEVILSDEYRRVYADIWQVLREEVSKSNEHLR